MKKNTLLLSLIIFALLFTFTLFPTTAQDDTFSTITVTTEGLIVNVRSGPGLFYSIRATLQPDITVIVTGRNDSSDSIACTDVWLQVVVFDGLEGWVSRCVVSVELGDPFLLPIVEPLAPSIIGVDVTAPEITGLVTDINNPFLASYMLGRAIVRSAPDLLATELGVVPANANVELLEQTASGQWIRIRYRGVEGWVIKMTVAVGPLQWGGLPIYSPPPAPSPNLAGTTVSGDNVSCTEGLGYEFRQFTPGGPYLLVLTTVTNCIAVEGDSNTGSGGNVGGGQECSYEYEFEQNYSTGYLEQVLVLVCD